MKKDSAIPESSIFRQQRSERAGLAESFSDNTAFSTRPGQRSEGWKKGYGPSRIPTSWTVIPPGRWSSPSGPINQIQNNEKLMGPAGFEPTTIWL
jgi:hypothetical protein